MRWRRSKGAVVPDETPDPLEQFGFDDGERAAFEQLQRAMNGNPALQKKVLKRIRRMERARGMAPSIKEKR